MVFVERGQGDCPPPQWLEETQFFLDFSSIFHQFFVNFYIYPPTGFHHKYHPAKRYYINSCVAVDIGYHLTGHAITRRSVDIHRRTGDRSDWAWCSRRSQSFRRLRNVTMESIQARLSRMPEKIENQFWRNARRDLDSI